MKSAYQNTAIIAKAMKGMDSRSPRAFSMNSLESIITKDARVTYEAVDLIERSSNPTLTVVPTEVGHNRHPSLAFKMAFPLVPCWITTL